MSSFWRKFQNVTSRDDQNDSSLSQVLSYPKSCKPKLSISQSDEDPFLKDFQDATDHLAIKSQILLNYETLMKNGPAFPYFIDFLKFHEAEHYALCWVECEKFKLLSQHLTFLNSSQPECQHDPIKLTDPEETHHEQTKIIKCDEDHPITLPDLVRNIPQNASVTPLPSPDDGDSKLSSPKFNNVSEKDDSIQIRRNILNINKRTLKNSYASQILPTSWMELSLEGCESKLRALSLEICDKYINSYCSNSISLSDSVRNTVIDNAKNNINLLQHNLFVPVQDEIYVFIEKEFFQAFLRSEYFLKFQVDVFTSQTFTLQDLLSCDSALPYFMEYMEQEGGQPLLEFWISAFNFKRHLEQSILGPSYNAELAQSDAMILYDKYFSLQATHTLGFSDRVRFLVESNICQENGPSPQCFDVPLLIVLHLINQKYLREYLSSSLHIKFVSELTSTLKLCTFGRKKRSGSSSTCSSEHSYNPSSSVSRRNTLLAMDTSSASSQSISGSGTTNLLKNLDESSLTMRIDATHILDPDSLWRRKNFTKLSCGYVDELGRFESDLQPEPDRKTESRFSQKLKKLANIEEKKVKEDMAYKLAEMIIKDVTNVTLRGSRQTCMRVSCSETQMCNLTAKMTRSSSDIFLPRM